MKRKHASGSVSGRMDLTPMIDVTFLLLVFFLLGTDFRDAEGKLEAHLPKQAGVGAVHLQEELVVSVLSLAGQEAPVYRVAGVDYPTVAALERKLRALRGISPTMLVTIDPAPAVSYEAVMHALNACVKVGYAQIAFAAAQAESEQM